MFNEILFLLPISYLLINFISTIIRFSSVNLCVFRRYRDISEVMFKPQLCTLEINYSNFTSVQ